MGGGKDEEREGDEVRQGARSESGIRNAIVYEFDGCFNLEVVRHYSVTLVVFVSTFSLLTQDSFVVDRKIPTF